MNGRFKSTYPATEQQISRIYFRLARDLHATTIGTHLDVSRYGENDDGRTDRHHEWVLKWLYVDLYVDHCLLPVAEICQNGNCPLDNQVEFRR